MLNTKNSLESAGSFARAGKYSNSDLTAWTMLFSLPDTWTMKAPRQPVHGGSCARRLPGECLVCAAVLSPLSVTPKPCCFRFPAGSQLFSPSRRSSGWAWGVPGSSQSWGEAGQWGRRRRGTKCWQKLRSGGDGGKVQPALDQKRSVSVIAQHSASQKENPLKIFAVGVSGSVNARKLDVMGGSASNLMGLTVPCIGAEYIHPSSVMSALNSQLSLVVLLWKYVWSLTVVICCLCIGGGGRKERFHGLENKGFSTASAKSHDERKNNTEEGPENV